MPRASFEAVDGAGAADDVDWNAPSVFTRRIVGDDGPALTWRVNGRDDLARSRDAPRITRISVSHDASTNGSMRIVVQADDPVYARAWLRQAGVTALAESESVRDARPAVDVRLRMDDPSSPIAGAFLPLAFGFCLFL